MSEPFYVLIPGDYVGDDPERHAKGMVWDNAPDNRPYEVFDIEREHPLGYVGMVLEPMSGNPAVYGWQNGSMTRPEVPFSSLTEAADALIRDTSIGWD